MSKYEQFIFESYEFDPVAKTLELNYSLDGTLGFKESYKFDFDFVDYDKAALDRALQLLYLMAGVSYYKTYVPGALVVNNARIDQALASFLSKTWQNGLGEFFYLNQLDPETTINFPVNVSGSLAEMSVSADGLLVGIGGGKDSLVTVEALRDKELDVATWSVNHRPQLTPLVDRIRLKHYWVEREWDKKLLSLNESGALNGHVPISAILSCVGLVVAVLSGRKDIVVSNEKSANEATLDYLGHAINHQYSKSQEYEYDFQSVITHLFGESFNYYSFLRPLSELFIAEIFARKGFDKYKDVFSSCNRAFTHSSNQIFWDGKCPKCAFSYLIFTPFVDETSLNRLFNNKNLFVDSELDTTYQNLLGIEGGKPLDCVGEIKESRSAMELAKQKHTYLDKYTYELPDDYNYKKLGSHLMPSYLFEVLKNLTESFSSS